MIDRLPDFGARFYDEGIRVLTSPTRRDEFASSAGIKTTAWLVSLLEFRAKCIPGVEDAILLDTKGHVSEGSASNIFVVIDGKLRTPPPSCGALPGITRAAVLSLAHAAGVASDDSTPIHPGEVVAADEVFLTSSIREIVPVISVDEQTIGTGKPGTITRSIMTAYRELTA
jgi:branched-chain amino acid aminotransferase